MSNWIILDRTPITDHVEAVLRRQNVLLPSLERTSYPSWFFSRAELEAQLEVDSLILLEWRVPEDRPWVSNQRLEYSGFLIKADAKTGLGRGPQS
jgi:hypothetical protein